MTKKLLTTMTTLLAVFALAACSNNADNKAKTNSSESSSKASVSKSSSSSSTEESSSSTEASATAIAPSDVKYLTDEEIAAVQTVGDFKNAYKSLTASYVQDFEHLISQVPTEAQEILKPTRDSLVKMFDDQLVALEEQFTSQGITDETPIPETAKESLVTTLKQSRDQLIQAMSQAREQAGSALQ